MTGAEEELQKLLDRVIDPGLQRLTPAWVVPANTPGEFVLKRGCNCSNPPGEGHNPAVTSSYTHHHRLKFSVRLWRQISEERDWPQKGLLL